MKIKWGLTVFFAASCLSLIDAQEPSDSIKETTLSEFIIDGSSPMISTKGALTTIQIQGTPFAKIGSVKDMLGNLPGLFEGASGIEVMGLGAPTFVVDGREITDPGQLAVMKSTAVKCVSIEKAPGAEYSSASKVLVIITTKKSIEDYIYLDISNTLGVRREVSDSPSIDFRFQFKKFKTSLTYEYSTFGNVNKETYFKKISHPTYDFNSKQNRIIPTRENSHTINWSGEYNLNPYNHVGLYYYYSGSHQKDSDHGTNEIDSKGIYDSFEFTRKANTDSFSHSATAEYEFRKASSHVKLIQDFAWKNFESSALVDEGMKDGLGQSSNLNDKKYHISITNVRAGFLIPWATELVVGAKINYIKSTTHTEIKGNMAVKDRTANDIELTEVNPQAYLQLEHTFKNVTIRPGIRYEYMHRKINNIDLTNERNNIIKSINSSFFPFLTVLYSGYPFSGWAYYSRRVVNPEFSILNSGTIYKDFLSYEVDNPNIRPTIINEVWGQMSYKTLGFSLRYRHNQNYFTEVEMLRYPDKNIVNSVYVNIPWMQSVMIGLSYSNAYKGLCYFAQIYLDWTYSKIPAISGFQRNKNAAFDFEANLNYRINDKFSVYTNVSYQGKRERAFTRQKSACNWNVGASANFFNDRLNINLQLSDILKKANYNNVWSTYMNVTNGTYGSNDMRGVKLTISYTIFNKPIQLNVQQGNSDIIYRAN